MKYMISNRQLKEFGVLLGFIYPLFIGWFIPALAGHDFRFWTIFVGIPFLLFGLINPKLLLIPYKLWMKLGYFLGLVNGKIILSLVYFFILIPIAMIMKLSGYDPLRNKNKKQKSYREINKQNKIDFTRIF